MRLYDYNEQIEQLLNLVDENGELPESVFEKIAELQIGETEKIESISCFIKDLRAESAEIAEEAKRLQARKKPRNLSRNDSRHTCLDTSRALANPNLRHLGLCCRFASQKRLMFWTRMLSSNLPTSILIWA